MHRNKNLGTLTKNEESSICVYFNPASIDHTLSKSLSFFACSKLKNSLFSSEFEKHVLPVHTVKPRLSVAVWKSLNVVSGAFKSLVIEEAPWGEADPGKPK